MKKSLFLLLFCASCALVRGADVPQKQTVVTPTGIVSQPNEYGQLSPGTLNVGNNIAIRRKGVIEPRPEFEQWRAMPAARVPVKVLQQFTSAVSGGGVLIASQYASGTRLDFDNGGGGFPVLYPDGSDLEFLPGRAHAVRTRDRWVMSTDDGPTVWDGNNAVARRAGLPMPSYIEITTATAGTVLTDQNYVSYRAVFRKQIPAYSTFGAYSFQGAVSAPYYVQNVSGSDCNPDLKIRWDSEFTPIAVGDQIDVYRTEQQDTIDLVDDRYRYAFTYTLTSGDLVNGFATMTDSAFATAADLYFDQSQEGASQNNFMPPPSIDVHSFKESTFYVATEAWHTRSLRAKYLWGSVGTEGVGTKEKTGSWLIASNLITLATITGVEVGMQIDSGGKHPAGTTVLSYTGAGPYILTVSAVSTSASSGGGQDILFYDVIEINGVVLQAGSAPEFASNLATANSLGTVPVVAMPDRALIVDTRFVNFTLLLPVSSTGPFTIRATHGDRYTPPLPNLAQTAETSSADPRTNRLYFSKIQQPEAVAPSSYLFVGHGTIIRIFATEAALYAFCTDGIYSINGDGDDWSVEPFDLDTVLFASDAIDSLNNTIFALTNNGFVAITDNGVEPISNPLIGNRIKALQKQFMSVDPAPPFTWGIQIAADKHNNEVWLNFNDYEEEEQIATYIWNTETNTFTTQDDMEFVAIGYADFMNELVIADPASIYIYSSGDDYMPAEIEFNPVFGEDVGYLKQWIDTTMLFEEMSEDTSITPSFEGVSYSVSHTITAGANIEEVAPVLQNYAYNKHCRFGVAIDGGDAHWALLGVTYRYRIASETLRD